MVWHVTCAHTKSTLTNHANVCAKGISLDEKSLGSPTRLVHKLCMYMYVCVHVCISCWDCKRSESETVLNRVLSISNNVMTHEYMYSTVTWFVNKAMNMMRFAFVFYVLYLSN